jgi:hypothetical protein
MYCIVKVQAMLSEICYISSFVNSEQQIEQMDHALKDTVHWVGRHPLVLPRDAWL